MAHRNIHASLFLMLLSAASVSLSGHADAHAHLLSSTPPANRIATPPPTELRLKFSERLEIRFTTVTVTGANKAVLKSGPAALDPHDDTVLIVPLAGRPPDGNYRVDWQALATDGHKTKGSYSFDIAQ